MARHVRIGQATESPSPEDFRVGFGALAPRDGAFTDLSIDGTLVATDPLGLAPLYVGCGTGDAPVSAGSEAIDQVGEGGDFVLAPEAMYQDVALGFRVGNRSLFHGVERVPIGEGIRVAQGKVSPARLDASEPMDAIAGLESVKARLAHEAGDAMIELSGGVDSRVVLALCLAADSRPRAAMTLGDEDSPDVIVARQIAARFGIEHTVIKAKPVPEQAFDDALAFARASGYACSACSYAWLPSVFRRLEGEREVQLSGVGGERAGGFYFTPADRFVGAPGFLKAWTRYRLLVPAHRADSMFRPEVARRAREGMGRALRDTLVTGDDPWRARVDRLYAEHRLRRWGGAAMRAATHWYGVCAPMLWHGFSGWIDEVARPSPDPRRSLVALIGELSPELAAMPYANDIRPAGAPPKREPRAMRLAKKIARRLASTRKAPDLGAGRAASALANDPPMAECVDRLLERAEDVLDARAIRDMLASPEGHAHELGFLFTWALAHHDVEHASARRDALGAASPTREPVS